MLRVSPRERRREQRFRPARGRRGGRCRWGRTACCPQHSPEASEGLRDAARRWAEQGLALIRDGRSRGEVREGPPGRVALTVLAPLHGHLGLAVGGAPLPQTPDRGLDDVIASVVRACAPE
ncbi:hypothetical protein ABZ697_14290 [Streptomyces albidoflavus]|uniref:hypothetical protein n=1 Tax=Streptomyces albidoflavus TaxID=1886 RepID=UPI0033E77913